MTELTQEQRENLRLALEPHIPKTADVGVYVDEINQIYKGSHGHLFELKKSAPDDVPIPKGDPRFKQLTKVAKKANELMEELSKLDELVVRKIEIAGDGLRLPLEKDAYSVSRVVPLSDELLSEEGHLVNSLSLDIKAHVRILETLSQASNVARINTELSNKKSRNCLSRNCFLVKEIEYYLASQLEVSLSGSYKTIFSNVMGIILGMDNPSEIIRACQRNPRYRNKK